MADDWDSGWEKYRSNQARDLNPKLDEVFTIHEGESEDEFLTALRDMFDASGRPQTDDWLRPYAKTMAGGTRVHFRE